MPKILFYLKKSFNFVKTWFDAVVLLPLALFLIMTNTIWIRFIDPTADVMDVGFLSILNLNTLKFIAIFLLSYLIWQLYFRGDIFNKGWEDKLIKAGHVLAPYVISLVLWLSTLLVAMKVILQDL